MCNDTQISGASDMTGTTTFHAFAKLPTELKVNVLTHLDPDDLSSAAQVSEGMSLLVNEAEAVQQRAVAAEQRRYEQGILSVDLQRGKGPLSLQSPLSTGYVASRAASGTLDPHSITLLYNTEASIWETKPSEITTENLKNRPRDVLMCSLIDDDGGPVAHKMSYDSFSLPLVPHDQAHQAQINADSLILMPDPTSHDARAKPIYANPRLEGETSHSVPEDGVSQLAQLSARRVIIVPQEELNDRSKYWLTPFMKGTTDLSVLTSSLEPDSLRSGAYMVAYLLQSTDQTGPRVTLALDSSKRTAQTKSLKEIRQHIRDLAPYYDDMGRTLSDVRVEAMMERLDVIDVDEHTDCPEGRALRLSNHQRAVLQRERSLMENSDSD